MQPADIDLQQLTVKLLKADLDITCFNCDIDDSLGLNEFIHKEAMQYQNESRGITYLFFYNDMIVGYVTVAMHAIEVKETRLRRVTREKHYPALLLGRLAVANNYRNRNVGHSLCLWTIGLAKEMSKRIGCRFVVLLTEQTKVGFYQKCGFEICPKYERKAKVLLYSQIA